MNRLYYSCGAFRSKGSSVCSANSIRKQVAEDEVVNRLSRVLSKDRILKAIVDKMNHRLATRTLSLQAELEHIRSQLEQARLKDGTNKFMPGKVAALMKWNNRPFLDKMIDDDTPVKELVAWCNDNGFPISVPTMYSYIQQRRESVVNDLTKEQLQPKNDADSLKKALEDSAWMKAREKGNTQYKENRAGDRAKIKATLVKELADQDSPKRIRHDMELLDEVIQKGFNTLNMMEVISPVTAIKAIEMKHKLSNGSAGGYTHYGLEEIKMREAAREQAITAAILEFVPEDQHNAVIKRMEDVTRAYYESIGLGEVYRQMEAMN